MLGEHTAHDEFRDQDPGLGGLAAAGEVKDAEDELHWVIRRLVHSPDRNVVHEELDASGLPVDGIAMIDADVDGEGAGRERLREPRVAEGVDAATDPGR